MPCIKTQSITTLSDDNSINTIHNVLKLKVLRLSKEQKT